MNYFELQIKKRDLTINLSQEKIASWAENKFVTCFFNALSSLFPISEKFFIASVKKFKNDIKNHNLKIQVENFIRQEAYHSGFHDQYNELLIARGYQINRIVSDVEIIVKFVHLFFSPKQLLAITVACEHFTASLGDYFYRRISVTNWDASYLKLWQLHVIEEIEHKSVAFDVYKEVKGSYITRITAIFLVIIAFTGLFSNALIYLLRKEKKLWKMKTLVNGSQFLFGKRGLFWNFLKWVIQYLKPNFHPWNYNNYFLVTAFDQELN